MTTARLKIYEFLATPAHLWLWICARLVGAQFSCGPVEHQDYSLDE